MNFRTRHMQIDPDPLKELLRRRQIWASCPGDDGGALKPYAQIVPLDTVNGAIASITRLRLAVRWLTTAAVVIVVALAAHVILRTIL